MFDDDVVSEQAYPEVLAHGLGGHSSALMLVLTNRGTVEAPLAVDPTALLEAPPQAQRIMSTEAVDYADQPPRSASAAGISGHRCRRPPSTLWC